jgi:hypothetical protein
VFVDPAFAGGPTLLVEVERVAALEAEGGAILPVRPGAARGGGHACLPLGARFHPSAFTAPVMPPGARRIRTLPHDVHRYPLGA